MTPRPRRTLRWRLTVWYTAALGGMLAVLGAAALFLLDRALRTNVDVTLASIARNIMAARSEAERRGSLDRALTEMMGPLMAERLYRLLDPYGRPDPRLAPQPPQKELPLSPLAQRNAAGGRETFETVEMPGKVEGPVRLLTVPVVERGQLTNLVQVALPLESVESADRQFLLILLALGPLALIGIATGGWLLAGRALAPVDAMVDAARQLTAEDLSLRLEGAERNDELGRLAAVLNDMLARLERSFGAARGFSADAAHELRTPLTILKGEIEVALRDTHTSEDSRRVLESCEEEVNRLVALVEDLLFLARSDAGVLEHARQPVNLAEVIQDVRPGLQALAERGGARLEINSEDSVWVQGSAPMLFRIVFNLVDNAVKHGGRDSTVVVSLTKNEREALLTVDDDGPGIDEQDRAHIFDRFYRADRARPRGGAGLGLALVRSIVELHGGGISADSLSPRGTRFAVHLPL